MMFDVITISDDDEEVQFDSYVRNQKPHVIDLTKTRRKKRRRNSDSSDSSESNGHSSGSASSASQPSSPTPQPDASHSDNHGEQPDLTSREQEPTQPTPPQQTSHSNQPSPQPSASNHHEQPPEKSKEPQPSNDYRSQTHFQPQKPSQPQSHFQHPPQFQNWSYFNPYPTHFQPPPPPQPRPQFHFQPQPYPRPQANFQFINPQPQFQPNTRSPSNSQTRPVSRPATPLRSHLHSWRHSCGGSQQTEPPQPRIPPQTRSTTQAPKTQCQPQQHHQQPKNVQAEQPAPTPLRPRCAPPNDQAPSTQPPRRTQPNDQAPSEVSPKLTKLTDQELMMSKKETGNRHFRCNNFNEAIRSYREAAELAKKLNNTDMSAILHFNLAMSYDKLGAHNQAADECAAAVRLNDNYIKAHVKRAEIFMFQGKYEEAVICYEHVCDLDSTKKQDALGRIEKAKQWSKLAKKRDQHEILGLKPHFSLDDLRAAYKQKARAHHPDKHSDADIVTRRIHEKIFKETSEAYSFFRKRFA